MGLLCSGCMYDIDSEDEMLYDDYGQPWHTDCYVLSEQEELPDIDDDGFFDDDDF